MSTQLSPQATGPILVPLTLSPSAYFKVPVIEQQARALARDVLLVHVLRDGAPVPAEGLVPSAEAHARAHLDVVAAALRARGLRARSVVRRGPVGSAVRAAATEQRAALIVVGEPPPPGGLLRLPRRSPAHEIARLAPCPVLIARRDGPLPSPAASGSASGPARAPQAARCGAHRALRHFDDDAALAGPLAPRAVGTRTVEFSRIVGTVPPLRLDSGFLPVRRTREDDDRHARLMRQLAERPERLAPPELYKLGYGYYVFAGHGHVAAAHAVGHAWIDASVTEYAPVADGDAQRVLAERAAFERETGLTGIGAALPGTYAALRRLIDEFAAGEDLQLAALRWKTAIFRPVQRGLRALRLNEHFPGERSADIAVRLAAHREEETRRRGREMYWDEALGSFAAALRGHTGLAA